MAIKDSKDAYRQKLLAIRDNTPLAIKQEWLLQIIERLLAVLLEHTNAHIIAGYMPIRGELDMLQVMRQLAEKGKELALPRMRDGELDFAAWQYGGEMVNGPFGTQQPNEQAPAIIPDIILVPLLGFDRKCHRIGYGGGYYDRVALRYPRVLRIGLAYKVQMMPAIPVYAGDMALDMVITEDEVIHNIA